MTARCNPSILSTPENITLGILSASGNLVQIISSGTTSKGGNVRCLFAG